tara:strand:+ start:5441 stop:5599 length:159 start_codon:yes stop_codon:yes gene_type:complete
MPINDGFILPLLTNGSLEKGKIRNRPKLPLTEVSLLFWNLPDFLVDQSNNGV